MSNQLKIRRGMTAQEAADYLGVSAALLQKDRAAKNPQIPFSKICGRVVYFTDRLDQYITQVEFSRGAA